MRNETEVAELADEVAKIPYWYHKIELPGGLTTPGWAPIDASKYRIPEDMKGMRVLDVGSWDGYWTWEALKRGAMYVVAIDDFSDELGDMQVSRQDRWRTWDLCQKAFGYRSCQRLTMSVYDIGRLTIQFDAIFCFGTLYHLKHPTWALERLRSVANPGCTIHIESAILDDVKSPYTGFGIRPGNCLAEYYDNGQFGKNKTNYCVPTIRCIESWLRMTGWSDVKSWKLCDIPTGLHQCRGFASAKVDN